MHCILLQVSKKKKRNTCMLIWEKLHDFIILNTFLLYLFHQGDFDEYFYSFRKQKTESQSLQVLWKRSIIKIMARPFYKTSGFGCTVNFVFACLYLWCLVDDS